jgi:hypothetical protein
MEPNIDNNIYALSISGSTAYVGGDFTSISGKPAGCFGAILQ